MPLKHVCKCNNKSMEISKGQYNDGRSWFEKLKSGASNILEKGGNLAKIAGNIGLKVGEFTANPELMAISEGLVLGGGAADYIGRRIETGTEGMEQEEIDKQNQYLKDLGKRVYNSGTEFISKKRNNYEL